MLRVLSKAILVGLALAWAHVAAACVLPAPPLVWTDKPISIASDGSFKDAGDDVYVSLTGNAVLDIGGGKIGQRLLAASGCSHAERLLVVDCDTAEMIVISGRADPGLPVDLGAQPSTTVSMLYPPHGNVRLTRRTTIDGLVTLSKAQGYAFETDLGSAFGGGKKKNLYNPFHGCGLFYPDSAGAKK